MHSEDSDQTGWMPRLTGVFAGCTGHFVGFVMLQQIVSYEEKFAKSFLLRRLKILYDNCHHTLVITSQDSSNLVFMTASQKPFNIKWKETMEFDTRIFGKGRNWVTVRGYMPPRRKNVDTLTSSQTLIPPFQIQTKIP